MSVFCICAAQKYVCVCLATSQTSWYSDWATGWFVRGSNPGRCWGFKPAVGFAQLPIQRVPGCFPWTKRPGRDSDH